MGTFRGTWRQELPAAATKPRPPEAERLRRLYKHLSGRRRRQPWPATEQASRPPLPLRLRPLEPSELDEEDAHYDDARNLARRSAIGRLLGTRGAGRYLKYRPPGRGRYPSYRPPLVPHETTPLAGASSRSGRPCDPHDHPQVFAAAPSCRQRWWSNNDYRRGRGKRRRPLLHAARRGWPERRRVPAITA
jgi:hypothetical protein